MTIYYIDHLTVAEKETTSSNFCKLVDAAVMLYEEEHRQEKFKCHIRTEKEEESDKRFFHVFPRKRRTSVNRFVSKRRNTQQNFNGPSSSSSSSSLFPGNYKISADSETKTPQNPRFSSSLFLGDHKIAAESEEMVMRNSQNPNSQSCLTGNKSRKRSARQESKPASKPKKAKVATFSWKERENPEWLIQLMRDMNGTDLSLIFERTLFKTDVNPGECRLSMPFSELISNDFLKPVESRIIEEDINNATKMGVGAILVDQSTVKWGVMLKRWEMKKVSGKGSWSYALTCGWNDIVNANGLKYGDDISIWSFRWRGILCFALVTPPPPSMALSSSSLALSL